MYGATIAKFDVQKLDNLDSYFKTIIMQWIGIPAESR
jgi:hypothetical protein